MKFESMYGIGEILIWQKMGRDDRQMASEMVEVVSIIFGKNSVSGDGEHVYNCRFPDGRTVVLSETELQGDPDFDQEDGCYHDWVIRKRDGDQKYTDVSEIPVDRAGRVMETLYGRPLDPDERPAPKSDR